MAKMDLIKLIPTLVQEINAYQSHGLFAEARKRCSQLEQLIRKSNKLKNKEKLLASMSKKIKRIEADAARFEAKADSVQMSSREKDLVKQLFSHPAAKDKDMATFKAAEALLVFGQFEEAVKEFNKLIKSAPLRLVAAKNIIRCYLELSALENAVSQYNEWLSVKQFPAEQLEQVRSFLQAILDRKKAQIKLPKPKIKATIPVQESKIELSTDIISITIPSIPSAKDRKDIELDVGYHKGSEIMVFIDGEDKSLVAFFHVGIRLNNVQFNAHDLIYVDSCLVTEKKQVRLGSKKGNYAVSIKIINS